MIPLNTPKTSGWSQAYLSAEMPVMTRESVRQTTLVDFRGSNLSDAGSIPAISTFANVQLIAGHLAYLPLDKYIRSGYIALA